MLFYFDVCYSLHLKRSEAESDSEVFVIFPHFYNVFMSYLYDHCQALI